MIREQDLDFWIKHNYNVLFIGHAGVGKTSIVKEAFNRNQLRWKYFSASTMDPWVDMIGVPKEQKDDDGTPYLDLVRPRDFQKDEIDALFFDEFNRSHKKVRNACMELLQFKSINGKKFNNLKLVWAAINPDDEGDYDVEKLDPAQEDRFHIKVQVPYKPDRVYFIRNYGEDVAKAAISWWDGLPAEQKVKVSPRRLDYALDVFRNNGDMRYVLHEAANVSKLVLTLKHGPISEALQKLQDAGNVDGARAFLAQENNYAAALEWLVKRVERMKFFIPALPLEKVSTLIAGYKTALDAALDLVPSNEEIKKLIENILGTSQNKNLANKIRKEIKMNKTLSDMFIVPKTMACFNMGIMPEKPFFNQGLPTSSGGYIGLKDFTIVLNQCSTFMQQHPFMNTQDRRKLYKMIESAMPPKLTTQQALDALEFYSKFAAHSHVKTLLGLKTFMGCVNHCINQLSQNEHLRWDQIEKKYKDKLKHLVQKMKVERSLGEKLYCPNGQTVLNADGKISVIPVDEIKSIIDAKKKKAI